MTPPPSPPSPPPQYATNELRRIASPFPKEEGASKLRSSSRARKNACHRNRQKRLRHDSADEQTRRCSAVALDYWNKNLKPDGVWFCLVSSFTTYKCRHMQSRYRSFASSPLLTSVGFIESPSFCFHANFKAKPKYDHSAEAELFFAELKGNIYKKKAYKVTNVCALGQAIQINVSKLLTLNSSG